MSLFSLTLKVGVLTIRTDQDWFHRAKRGRRLRLPYTFRWTIFFKSGFLGQNIGRNVISNLRKKLLKKTKYWRRNRGFTFSPEVCLRSKKIFSALFSRNNIFLRWRHFKELQVKENLFNCPQIWTVASLTYKLQNLVCELLISRHFFF